MSFNDSEMKAKTTQKELEAKRNLDGRSHMADTLSQVSFDLV